MKWKGLLKMFYTHIPIYAHENSEIMKFEVIYFEIYWENNKWRHKKLWWCIKLLISQKNGLIWEYLSK